MRNAIPHSVVASRMRLRSASWSVRWTIVSRRFMRGLGGSSGALIAAHDLEELGLERRAGGGEVVEADAAGDETPGDLGQHVLVLDAQPHEFAVAADVAAEGFQ